MDIQPLKIELVRQEPNTNDALRACALMVFDYYREPVTKVEIWNRLHVYKKHSGLKGGYLQDLGILAMKLGFKSIIYLNDWSYWNQQVVNAVEKSKGVKSALRKYKADLKDWPKRKEIAKDIKYYGKGGVFVFQIPDTDIIDNNLNKRIPVLIIIRASDLYRSPKENYDHAILLVGKKKDNYIVRDPYLAVEKINKERLQFMVARAGGWMMVILPKEKKPITTTLKVKQNKLKF